MACDKRHMTKKRLRKGKKRSTKGKKRMTKKGGDKKMISNTESLFNEYGKFKGKKDKMKYIPNEGLTVEEYKKLHYKIKGIRPGNIAYNFYRIPAVRKMLAESEHEGYIDWLRTENELWTFKNPRNTAFLNNNNNDHSNANSLLSSTTDNNNI